VIQKLKGVKLRCIEKGGWTKESMSVFYEKCSAYKGYYFNLDIDMSRVVYYTEIESFNLVVGMIGELCFNNRAKLLALLEFRERNKKCELDEHNNLILEMIGNDQPEN